ncbi:MAG: YraN family protein [Bacteroidales bacterium]
MSDLYKLGPAGEEIAARHLEEKGYKIRNRNWKWGQKEIDIIAENKDYIVFVEVKTRKEDYYVHPRNAVTDKKQKTIILAADNYIRIFKIEKESRFDIITVVSEGQSHSIEHIENAFYPTLR